MAQITKKEIDIWDLKPGYLILDPKGSNWEVMNVIKREFSGFFVRATGFDEKNRPRILEGYKDKTKIFILIK